MTSNSERWRELATEPEENKRVKKKRNEFESGRERSGKRQNDLTGHTAGNMGGKVISR